MKQLSEKFKFIWLFLCCVTLLLYIGSNRDGEQGVLFILRMLILTFPLGYLGNLVAAALDFLLFWLSIDISKMSCFVLQWLFMLLVGYFQWFVLLPKVYVWTRQKPTKAK